MSLADRITAADVVWIRRSVARREPGAADPADSGTFDASIAPGIGREPKLDNAPVVDLRARVEIEKPKFEATFEIQLRFVLGRDQREPSDEEGAEFMRAHAIDYAFGYLRAAMLDDLRTFGFKAGIMPVDALDQVKALDFEFMRERQVVEPA